MPDIKSRSDVEFFDNARYWSSVYAKRAMVNITGTNDMLDRQNLQLAIGLSGDAEKYRIKSENAEIQTNDLSQKRRRG